MDVLYIYIYIYIYKGTDIVCTVGTVWLENAMDINGYCMYSRAFVGWGGGGGGGGGGGRFIQRMQ